MVRVYKIKHGPFFSVANVPNSLHDHLIPWHQINAFCQLFMRVQDETVIKSFFVSWRQLHGGSQISEQFSHVELCLYLRLTLMSCSFQGYCLDNSQKYSLPIRSPQFKTSLCNVCPTGTAQAVL